MYQRFHAMREQREGGFTLIELLVVILIIAILAAIAIPVFLRQRQRGYEAQAESAAKNGATAVEAYATEFNGSYVGMDEATGTTGAGVDLTDYGFSPTADVAVTVEANASTYCINANHQQLTADVRYESADGRPEAGTCAEITP
jgi:type IV pilus assembly protein PilA